MVNGYTLSQLPITISVGNGLATPDVDYFATLDTAQQRLWITVNRSASSAVNLKVGASGGALPPLTIILSGANVVLTWPIAAAGFALQSTTNLVSPAVWSTVSPGPTVFNGQNVVTNPVSGTQQFYRLAN